MGLYQSNYNVIESALGQVGLSICSQLLAQFDIMQCSIMSHDHLNESIFARGSCCIKRQLDMKSIRSSMKRTRKKEHSSRSSKFLSIDTRPAIFVVGDK